jgi:hypothetical protein
MQRLYSIIQAGRQLIEELNMSTSSCVPVAFPLDELLGIAIEEAAIHDWAVNAVAGARASYVFSADEADKQYQKAIDNSYFSDQMLLFELGRISNAYRDKLDQSKRDYNKKCYPYDPFYQ